MIGTITKEAKTARMKIRSILFPCCTNDQRLSATLTVLQKESTPPAAGKPFRIEPPASPVAIGEWNLPHFRRAWWIKS